MPSEFEKDPIVGTLNAISRTAERYPHLPTLTRAVTALTIFSCAGYSIYSAFSDEIQAAQQAVQLTPISTRETPAVTQTDTLETRRQMEVHVPSPLFRVIDLAQWRVAPVGQGRMEIVLQNGKSGCNSY